MNIDFFTQNSAIYIGAGSAFNGRLSVRGSENVMIFASCSQMGGPSNITSTINGKRLLSYFGSGFTSVSSTWINEGSDSAIAIGDDAMISWGVVIRNHDSHGIFDIDAERIINQSGGIIVGKHCWIGQDACIMKSVTIGDGSIIEAKSLVNRDIGKNSIAAGCPAKVIRERVSWSRNSNPSHSEIAKIIERFDLYS